MEREIIKEMRDYAWKYFSLHSDQRIKTFNFYILLVTFSVGGMLTVIKDAKDSGHFWIITPIALLVAFLSFIFWKLDGRNKRLVKHGEAALKHLETIDAPNLPDEGGVPHVLRIFTNERHATAQLPRLPKADAVEAHMTYSDCFNAVFLVFGSASFVAGIAALIAHINQ